MKEIYTIEFINTITYNFDKCNFNDFLEMYKNLIQEDKIKPIYCLNNKYNLQNKIYKPIKFRCTNENKWAPSVPKTEIEKIKKTIKIILNKITEKNYSILIETLMCEINKFTMIDAIEILVSEIVEKIIFDTNFHNIYIKLCSKIWEMKNFHNNLITIILNENNKYYWYLNTTKENNELNGPYENEDDIREITDKKINFKYYLMNELQNRYKLKDLYIEKLKNKNLDDDIRFLYKKNIFAILEFIGKMYKKNIISDKIIHIILTDLIHYNINFEKQPEECYIEGFCILWNTINSKLIVKFSEELVHEYFKHITMKILKYNWCVRIEFMLEDMIETYKKIYKITDEKVEQKVYIKIDRKMDEIDEINKYVNEYLINSNIDELTIKLKDVDKYKLIELLLNKVIDIDVKKQKLYINLFKKENFINYEIFYQISLKFLENIQEIMLDIPMAKENLLSFISNFVKYKGFNNLLLLLSD